VPPDKYFTILRSLHRRLVILVMGLMQLRRCIYSGNIESD
jgi:hypothetical protein